MSDKIVGSCHKCSHGKDDHQLMRTGTMRHFMEDKPNWIHVTSCQFTMSSGIKCGCTHWDPVLEPVVPMSGRSEVDYRYDPEDDRPDRNAYSRENWPTS